MFINITRITTISTIIKPDGLLKLYDSTKIIITTNNQNTNKNGSLSAPYIFRIVNSKTRHVINTQNRINVFFCDTNNDWFSFSCSIE